MTDLTQDLRYAIRGLRRSPGFAAVAVLTLGLGIGANTAIFSVVNGILLKPLPYRDADRLVLVSTQFPSLGFDRFWVSPPEYLELREWSRTLASIGGYRTGAVSVATDDEPIRVNSSLATADFFTTLGVGPALGRTHSLEEDVPGAEPVVVISHGLWQRAFGGDSAIVGRSVQVDGRPRTVVGVMPPGFDVDDAGIDVWVPSGIDPANRQNRGSHFLNVVGRLAPGATLDQARAEMEALLHRWPEEITGAHTPNPETHRVVVHALQEERVGEVRRALFLLLGAVGFVLLIACANVASLLLARAESRQKEIAVRAAMGAGRRRLLRQFLTESVVLSLAGGLLGVLFAFLGVRTLLATSPDTLPRTGEITLDGSVLLFTLGVALLTGLLFGAAPLLHLTGRNLLGGLREGGQRATAGSARRRVRRGLVVGEIALAVVLVVGAGLLLRSFAALQRVDLGFDPDRMLTFQLYLPPPAFPDAGDQVAFLDRLTARIHGIAGVRGVAAMSGLPPLRDVNANDMAFEGLEQNPEGPVHNADYWQFVSTDYFAAMRIPIVAGRVFTASDDGEATPVAVVNERLARVFYPDRDPIGQRLRPGWGDYPWFTIVGVVRDVKQGGIAEQAGTEVYWHIPQVASALGFAPRTVNFVLRTDRAPMSVAPEARAAVWEIDPALPLAHLQTMERNVALAMNRPRFLALLLTLFACVALTLAAVGTYGVMAYSVAERNREIGIRMALGAERARVLRMVLGGGLAMAAAGLVLGMLSAAALSRVMGALLYEVSARDLWAYLAAPVGLAAVSLAACYIPARRATRVDPAVVLREEG